MPALCEDLGCLVYTDSPNLRSDEPRFANLLVGSPYHTLRLLLIAMLLLVS